MVLNLKPQSLRIRFFPAGAGAPTYSAQDTKGVATITRAAAGRFLITLQDTYKRLISASATVQMAAATDLVAQIGTVANVGTTSAVTVIVRLNAAATETDMAADANNSVSVSLDFDDSDV